MTTGGDGAGQLAQNKDILFLSRRDGGTRRPPDFGRLRNPAAIFSLFSPLFLISADSSEAGERYSL
jgi:hypothetical protein